MSLFANAINIEKEWWIKLYLIAVDEQHIAIFQNDG